MGEAETVVDGDGRAAGEDGSYLVECYWPGVTERRLLAAVARGRRHAGDQGVEYRGAILLPHDETALVLFDGPSAHAVRTVSLQAGLPFERVVASVAFWPPCAHASAGPEAAMTQPAAHAPRTAR